MAGDQAEAGMAEGLLTLGLEARAPLHFMFSLLSVLFSTVTFNHAGSPGLGEHPRVSRHGRNVGIVFGPVWAASAALNIWAFSNCGIYTP
jgi:hypothetical protein